MGKLILIGTTIGNIEDISIRSLKYIFQSPIILTEDTRVFKKFKTILKGQFPQILESLEITTNIKQTVKSYRDQNHIKIISKIIGLLQENNVVLTVDAGMPGISDPGYKLIREVIKNDFEIEVIPGPTAVSTALLLSGLPTDHFSFIGFLPRKKSRVKKLIDNYNIKTTTIVLFESPYRIVKTLKLIKEFYGNEIKVSALGEMTKKFQRVERGLIIKVLEKFEKTPPRGEWVLVFRLISNTNSKT